MEWLVRKESGKIVSYDKNEIKTTISGILESINIKDDVQEIVNQIEASLYIKYFKDGNIPTVKEVQNCVGDTLMFRKLPNAARAYILYREKKEEVKELKNIYKDVSKIVSRYLRKDDWEIKENSNMTFSLQGLNFYVSSLITTRYWLSEIYGIKIKYAHNNGDFHIHDLGILGSYCVGWSLYDLLKEGFKGSSGKVESSPAKHLRSALGQVVNFIYTLQGEAAGAQAFSNFDTLLAPFIRHDKLTYKEVKQALQEFLFNINVPTRVGFQTPFSNITMDLEPPEILKNDKVVIGGKEQKEVYGDFQKEMNMINKAFAELMMEGDAKGRIFTFPIPTYNITKDFDWDNKKLKPIWKITGKYGIPYFSNFVSSDMSPSDSRSMCCLTENNEILTFDNNINTKSKINRKKPSKIKIGDYLYGRDEKFGWLEKTKVIATNVRETDEFYKIHIKISRKNNHHEKYILEITDEHPIYIKRNKKWRWIEVKDLKVGDILYKWRFKGLKEEVEKSKKKALDFLYNGAIITKIEKINLKKPIKVYNFECSPHSNYFVDNFLVHNCRLRLDNRELRKRGGGLFGSDPLTGSIGVVTINLPRIGYLSSTKEDFFKRLNNIMELAKESLELKRKIIEDFTNKNLYPYTKYYLREVKNVRGTYWANHFSTIGLIGMNEACINFLKKNVIDDESRKFAIEVLNYMRNKLSDFQEETGNLYNLEATPAESATYRLAKKDKSEFNDIYTKGERVPYYTNSVHPPVDEFSDMFELLQHQDELQTLFTGGTVVHLFLGEGINDWEIIRNLVKKVVTIFKLPYFSITPTFSICPIHGYISGEKKFCPYKHSKEELEQYGINIEINKEEMVGFPDGSYSIVDKKINNNSKKIILNLNKEIKQNSSIKSC